MASDVPVLVTVASLLGVSLAVGELLPVPLADAPMDRVAVLLGVAVAVSLGVSCEVPVPLALQVALRVDVRLRRAEPLADGVPVADADADPV